MIKKISFVFISLFSVFSFNGNGQEGILYNWAKNCGGISEDYLYDLATDDSGNIYITGSFGNTVDFDPGPDTANLSSSGLYDIFFAKYDRDGNYTWAKKIGYNSADRGKGITVDNSGFVYLTGYFTGTVDFDPGPGISNLITSASKSNVYLARYDKNGNYLWAISIGDGLYSDSGDDLVGDDSGNVYILGNFSGNVDFDPGIGLYYLSSVSTLESDIFYAKYNSSGNIVWAKKISGSAEKAGYGIFVDSIKNVYLTGGFYSVVDFDPNGGIINLTSNGFEDLFFAKYDYYGNYLWANSLGSGANTDVGKSIIVDDFGNVIITGAFADSVDFDPGTGSSILTGKGEIDIFFARYDSNGNYLFAKGFGGTNIDAGMSVDIDKNQNIFLAGTFRGIVDFDPDSGVYSLTSSVASTSDVFFAKYDSIGNFIWADRFGNSYYDDVRGIKADDYGNIYLGGSFQGTVDLDPDSSVANLISFTNSAHDIYFGKYSCFSISFANENTSCVSCSGISSVIPFGGTSPYTYLWNNEVIDSTNLGLCNGNYSVTVTDANGCKVFGNTEITKPTAVINNVLLAICENDSIFLDGNYQTSAGVYFDSLTTVNGCDSIIITTLQVVPESTSQLVSICKGESYIFGSQTLDTSGNYFETFISPGGCDSTVELILSVWDTIKNTVSSQICNGDTFVFGSQLISIPGTYTDTFSSSAGCDSLVILTLTVISDTTIQNQITICNNDSILLQGDFQTTQGIYIDTLQSAIGGCDSIIETTLSILQATSSTINTSSCNSFTLNSQTYTSSGIYSQIINNSIGCDSIITLNLTINQSLINSQQMTICSGDSVSLFGNWQSQPGIYYDSLSSVNGCDSVVSIQLTVISTSLYSVVPIPFGFTDSVYNGTLTLSNMDDTWGGVINLPFYFSFFGKYYDKLVVGANGLISFNLSYEGSYCPWAFTDSAPSSTLPLNTIFGAYHDLDASFCGTIKHLISGNAPYRRFVLNFDQICHFDCDCGPLAQCKKTTQQIVLYETTNIIEIFLKDKPVCTGWNNGNALIGIQDSSGTTAFVPPWRNTGSWSAVNEGWRFIPGTKSQVSIEICSNDSIFLQNSFQTNAGIYYDTLSSVNGCDSIIETILTIMQVSSIQNPASICFGDSVFAEGAWQLTEGTYYDTLSTINGCDSVIITMLTINQNPEVIISTVTVSCYGGNDGTAIANVSGGISPYTYLWNNGEQSQSIDSVSAGNLDVTVTDFSGCKVYKSIFMQEPTSLGIIVSNLSDANCGQNNGAICTNVMGGVFPYAYQWNDPLTQTSSCADNLYAGCYTIFILDGNGCSKNSVLCIQDLPGPAITLVNSDSVTCSGSSNGFIEFSVSGALPLEIVWFNGAGDSIPAYNDMLTASSLDGGTYTIQITDVAGCISMQTDFINEPAPVVSAVTSATNNICNGNCSGSATISVFGGISPYTYLWNNGQNSETATGLCADSFSVIITDKNNCTRVQTGAISEPTELVISYAGSVPTCFSYCDGSIITNTTGGTPPYVFTWSPNDSSNPNVYNLCAGIYKTTVTDVNGCLGSDSVTVTEPDSIDLQIFSSPDSGNSSGSATVISAGGTPPYTFSWETGDTTSQISSAIGGQYYFVTVTDANGCSVADSVFVDVDVSASQISNLKLTSHISIIPNPNNGSFEVRFSNPSEFTNCELRVYNMLGEIVYQSYNSELITFYSIDISKQGSGMYYVRVRGEESTVVKKVVVK